MLKVKHISFRLLFVLWHFSFVQQALGENVACETDKENSGSGKTIISGRIHDYKQGDSIKLLIWNEIISDRYLRYLSSLEETKISANGEFRFNISNINKYSYFSIYSGTDPEYNIPKVLLFNPVNKNGTYLIVKGDSLFIDFRKDTILFSGRDKNNLECQYKMEMNNINNRRLQNKIPPPKYEKIQGKYFFGYDVMERLNFQEKEYFESDLKILNQYRNYISNSLFALLHQNLIYRYKAAKLFNFKKIADGLILFKNDSSLSAENIIKVQAEFKKISNYYTSNSFKDEIETFNPENVFPTKEAISYYLDLARIRLIPDLTNGSEISTFVSERYKGVLKDLVSARYILENQLFLSNKEIDRHLSAISDRKYKKQVYYLLDNNKAGQKAFNFELRDLKNKTVRLSDFKGKVVFIDFWFTGCGACRSYYSNILEKVEEKYKDNKNLVFLPICVDAVDSTFRDSANKGIYTSADKVNVINLTTAPFGANHELIKKYHISGYPSPLIIDKNGYIFNYSKSELRKKEYLLKRLEEALGQ